MKKSDLNKLNEVAGIISDVDLASLADLQRALSELTRQAAELSGSTGPEDKTDGLDPALRAGAGPLWNIWRQERLRQIQLERARLAAEVETARRKASRSFGRTIALSELLAREP
jgi:hypothetical protein